MKWTNLQSWTDLAYDEVAANKKDGKSRTYVQDEAIKVVEKHLMLGDITADDVRNAAANSKKKFGL